MMRLRRSVILIALLLSTSPLLAKEWYDAYAEGIKAARAKNWSVVVQKMNEAIRMKPNEGARERTYGAIFLNYRPYYYRGVANFHLGNFDEALRDLQRTGGAGEVDLGSAESFVGKAEQRLAGNNQRPPDPTPVTTTQATSTQAVTPRPPVPTADPAIETNRRNAERLIAAAEQQRNEAMAREAQGFAAQQFTSAQNLLLQAQTRRSNAETAADWKAVGDLADRAQRGFSLATTTAIAAATKAQTTVNTVADDVLGPARKRLRDALEDYFNGNFDRAAAGFQGLAGLNVAQIYAYLGASHYYSWYLGGNVDDKKLAAAKAAFRNARRLNPRLTLSAKYFSPRVRNFYETVK